MAKQSYPPGINENSQHMNVFQTESMAATEQPSFDLSDLKKLKSSNLNNPNLNINSLHYKIVDLRQILSSTELDVIAVSETKLNEEFPNSQFEINGYYNPAPYRRDRNEHGGGLMIFIKQGVPVKRIKKFELATAESICLEIAISRRK